jgi:hypothetical protein
VVVLRFFLGDHFSISLIVFRNLSSLGYSKLKEYWVLSENITNGSEFDGLKADKMSNRAKNIRYIVVHCQAGHGTLQSMQAFWKNSLG